MFEVGLWVSRFSSIESFVRLRRFYFLVDLEFEVLVWGLVIRILISFLGVLVEGYELFW